ncbi:MAG TPA: hypothetical protein DFS52_06065 [Myxococcales bacterium]|nr:hypothetical protein [Myxococcales bacterium]
MPSDAVGGERTQASTATAAAPSGAASADEDRREMERLRERLAQLEERVRAETRQRREAVGEPVTPPENLDRRFGQEAVVAAVNSALRDIGLRGEVTAADCAEYPCLVIGEAAEPFDRDRSQALRASDAFRPYGEDRTLGFGISVGEGRKHVFGLAVFARVHGEAEEARIRKRVDYRFWQLQADELK